MRILIADDDPVSRRMLERILIRLGHEVIAVPDGPEAVQALQAPDGPRMAILDWMMPGADGLSVCRILRQREGPYLYLILLTARDRREDMVAGLDAGADDFLTKPLDADELRSRLRSGARVLALQEGLLEAQDALRLLAAQDELTGLWNRRRITEQLEIEWRRARHEKRPLGVAVVDVDKFKLVNDTHGHAIGDQVLKEVARRMRLSIREYDAIGRYGGEEFLLVLPGCDADAGAQVAERVRMAVAAEPVPTDAGPLSIRVSIGVAWTPPAGVEPLALIRLADEALYRAKSGGRDRVAL
jgi:diguanylate cyclase (GGDEF)-like protein